MNLTRRNFFKFGAGAFAVVTAANIMPIKALAKPILILPKRGPLVYLISDHHIGMELFGSTDGAFDCENVPEFMRKYEAALKADHHEKVNNIMAKWRLPRPIASGEIRVLASGDVIIGA